MLTGLPHGKRCPESPERKSVLIKPRNMSDDEETPEKPTISKDLVKEALQDILNEIPAFRSLIQPSGKKDGGSSSSGGHTEPRTKGDSGAGNYCPMSVWAGARKAWWRTQGVIAEVSARSTM